MSLYHTLREKLYQWLTREPVFDGVMPYDFNRLKHEIHPGDVLLVEGRSRISSIIRSITQSSWTHAALYIGRLSDIEDEEIKKILLAHTDAKENVRLIIEDCLDKGTVVSTLSSYRYHHLRICRPIGITHSDIELVIQHMIKALGHPYNVRHLVDLARFVLPWSVLPRRWGSTLFRKSSGEPEGEICSSLIAEAFVSVQFPILPFIVPDRDRVTEIFHRNPYLYTPKDFDYSPYFDIIKYPVFNPDEPLPYYRRLPWTKSGFLHQDHGVLSLPKQKKARRFPLFGKRKTSLIATELPDEEAEDTTPRPPTSKDQDNHES